ncbi:UDP-N-acetylmuramoyl-L-alanyl-D-glutamate--2,6-diaminopimelate ligase [Microlunatus speluncae]|uniref:UDP-N-acetylmuramoyl-L-alanyl-D-glutamate--2, 6-diaminopimelate ligase n=1 Tax=Microlunatus speluncae TaxID=2594267 RepID=UPI003CCCFF48
MPEPCRLSDLFDQPGLPDTPVSGVSLSDRLVRPGGIFVALPGLATHGARFAPAAVRAGAVAIVTDAAGRELIESGADPIGVPVIELADPRAAMGPLAARVYGEPAERLTMIAVTGTNGKTTTCSLLEAALLAAGRRVGMIGTMGFRLDGVELPADRTTITTPEAPELQSLLAQMVERGADTVIMEVTSHALDQGRTDPIRFDVAAFTNLGRDHLDFHPSLDHYFEAKARLFTAERTRAAVINSDDPRGRELVGRLQAAAIPVRTIGTAAAADYAPVTVRGSAEQTMITARTPSGGREFAMRLPGDFNVRNGLTALAVLDLLLADGPAFDLDTAIAGLAADVPGRMQRVRLGGAAPAVYVDFAHTPQAIAAAIDALPAGTDPATAPGGDDPGVPLRGRRIVVVGCGGDRDPDKRGPMGAAAAERADVVVITDDNPRTEDPATIRAAALAGARATERARAGTTTVLDGGDRRAAIAAALRLSRSGDVIAILGKGHEQGQQIGTDLLPFDDATVAIEEWRRLEPAGQAGSQS